MPTAWPSVTFQLERKIVGSELGVALGMSVVSSAGSNIVIVAVPRTTWVEEFLAVTVTVCWVDTLVGAVYKPVWLMFPTEGLMDQVTPVPALSPCTENCCVPEVAKSTVAGVTLVTTGLIAGSEACSVT